MLFLWGGGGSVLGSSPNNVTQETSTSTFYLPKCVCVCVCVCVVRVLEKAAPYEFSNWQAKKNLGGGGLYTQTHWIRHSPPPCTCTCALLKKTQTRHSSIGVSLVSAGRGCKHARCVSSPLLCRRSSSSPRSIVGPSGVSNPSILKAHSILSC